MAWSSPVPVGTRIGSNFGRRGSSIHLGDDYPPPKPGQQGVPVYAIGDGVVVGVGANLLKGHSGDRNVLIKHPGNIYSYYGHLNSNSVRLNQSVKGGQQIGVMGYRGNVVPRGPGGTHLHLGIIVNGSFVDPSVWLSRKGIRVGTTPPVKASAPPKGTTPVPSYKYPNVEVGTGASELKSAWYQLLGALGYKGATWTRVQSWLKASGEYTGRIDNDFGPLSVAALQRRLRNAYRKDNSGKLLDPGPADGSRGAKTKKAEAAYLNAHRWRAK